MLGRLPASFASHLRTRQLALGVDQLGGVEQGAAGIALQSGAIAAAHAGERCRLHQPPGQQATGEVEQHSACGTVLHPG